MFTELHLTVSEMQAIFASLMTCAKYHHLAGEERDAEFCFDLAKRLHSIYHKKGGDIVG